ncbi:RagB/SusD family nutrient uptake outer membrane protein [Chitinophaga oryzae]|uniref:RagB/SusD family nutrient uptake outer membrane protein n=1 Tax=Chitinophaga oryzae TaxID=2725414 RepID=A0AAE6ZEY9_9BACT|nr:RagB/SusD family nutrient uptake outer membrane protein [Chitinophaga oryzae]QJB30347.1 RagB/SusD family nutrient uptake outer membrane protein [Chitinophaga oryzae]
MKRVCYFLSISICLCSCGKSFLDLNPETSINGAAFYKTEGEIEQAVNGAYNILQPLGTESYWIFGEMRSDNTAFQYNTADRGHEQWEFVDEFLAGATAECITNFWKNSYVGISRANDVLDNIPNVKSGFAAGKQDQYTGEAEFLRAFHYFNLVRQFGGVPLRDHSVVAPGGALSKGRATVDEVYARIIADLTNAAAKLPASYTGASVGRATSGAAYTLLGKVYLTRRQYSEALTALKKAAAMGYGLVPNYADNFDPGKKNGPESIFEIQYLGSQTGLFSTFMYIFAPYTSGSAVTGDSKTSINGSGSGWNIPTTDMISAYEPNDKRKDVSLAEGYKAANGSFVAIPYVKKYNHGYTEVGRTNDNFPVLRYADVLLMIAECLNEQAFVPNGEAFDLLNQVRLRAGLPKKTAGNPDPGLNIAGQEDFRKAVYHERQVELAFENHRWYDLVRTGKAVETMNAHGVREKQQKNYIPGNAYQVTTNRLLLPIPQTDINLDNLTQNPQ